MFSSNSSNTTINPFSHLPPSYSYHLLSHPPPPPFIGHDGLNNIFFHHHHHHHPDLLNTNMVSSTNSTISSTTVTAVSNKPTSTTANYHCSPKRKKDRHSKIRTAQGLRDRRVRLSIGISRKFFDLQDILGFDKASKTLDWLFTKSKAAIKELSQQGLSSSSTTTTTNTNESCEVVVSSTGTNEEGLIIAKEKRVKKQQIRGELDHVVARESRARARARARERTREKMCTRRLNCSNSSSLVLNQSCSTYLSNEDCVVIKGKLKPSSSISLIFNDHDQNISKEASCLNIPKNWDISAMSYMNLLQELQICSKPWEACHGQ